MPTYAYRAIDRQSGVQLGRRWASDEPALDQELSRNGLTLIEARPLFSLSLPRKWRRKFSDSDLLDLTYQLMLINASGIPLLEGLHDVIAEQRRKGSRLKPALVTLANGVESGMSLSGAMFSRADIFPGYYAQMFRAGETSGTLDNSIRYLMVYLEWQIEFRKTVRSAFRYPLVILALIAALGAILFAFVFPSLGPVLRSLAIELPLPTTVILETASFVRDHIVMLVAGSLAVLAAGKAFAGTVAGREIVDRWLLAPPLVGDLVRKLNLSRYFKTLATLLSAGVDMQTACASAGEVVGNQTLKNRLRRVTQLITNGESVSAALGTTKALTPLVVSMIALGEKTGNLEQALSRVSDVYDKEVPESIKQIFAVIEPFTVVLLGVMLLIVMLSIFLPMYSIVGNLRIR
jgi:type II secretory pathway component PulF